MDTTTEVIKLTNPNQDSMIARFIAVMGDVVKIDSTDWGDDDISKDYSFPKKTDLCVAWGGDDAIGAIQGAYIDEDDKLVGIFNFGDEGDCEVVIREGQSSLYILGDL